MHRDWDKQGQLGPLGELIRPYTASVQLSAWLLSIIWSFKRNVCILVSADGQVHDPQHTHTNSSCDQITNMTHKSHLQGWPLTLLSHPSPPPPSLNSPHKPLNESRGLRGRCEHRRWPQALSGFNPPPLSLSLTPPLWLGGYHTGSNLEIFPPPLPLSPFFLSLLLLLYILCDEECPPAAIVAKMWSRLPFPARLHLFPPALIPDRGFLEPGNWPAQLTDGQRGRKEA